MDVLRCKTPAMVRKEIWGHLLVYNLIRAAMAQAALSQGVLPRQLSLQGARQTLEAFRSQLGQVSSIRREAVIQSVLTAIAGHRVGNRPNRYEPRVCTRLGRLVILQADRAYAYQAGINTSSTSSQDLPSAKYRLHSSSRERNASR